MQGDAWELAKILPDQSVQCIVTSPPYWSLRDYGVTDQFGLEATPQEFVAKLVDLFRELRRVLRDDGTLWLNLGDSYIGSGGAGGWSKRKAGKQEYVGPRGNSNRLNGGHGLKPKDMAGIPWRVAFALQDDGWYLRSDIIWHKPNPQPESVRDRPTRSHEYIFMFAKQKRYYYDGDAVREPYTADSVARFKYSLQGTAPTARQPQNGDVDRRTREAGVREPNPLGRNRRSVWTVTTRSFAEAHFATFPLALIEPCILAGTSEVGNCPECGNPWGRVVQKPDMSQRPTRSDKSKYPTNNTATSGIHMNDNWEGTPKSAGQAYQDWRNENPDVTIGWRPTCEHGHEPVPSVVLDPFMGAGTTALVAKMHGRDSIGFELNPAYIELAEARIARWQPQVTIVAPPLEVQLYDLPLFSQKGKLT